MLQTKGCSALSRVEFGAGATDVSAPAFGFVFCNVAGCCFVTLHSLRFQAKLVIDSAQDKVKVLNPRPGWAGSGRRGSHTFLSRPWPRVGKDTPCRPVWRLLPSTTHPAGSSSLVVANV
jgi:hypothetical protein